MSSLGPPNATMLGFATGRDMRLSTAPLGVKRTISPPSLPAIQ